MTHKAFIGTAVPDPRIDRVRSYMRRSLCQPPARKKSHPVASYLRRLRAEGGSIDSMIIRGLIQVVEE